MQVFVFDMSDTSCDLLEKAKAFLSETEKQRLANMISVKRQKEFVCGHFLLRQLLCELFHQSLEDIDVQSMPTGALFLPKMPNIFVSLSHSNDKLAVAIGNCPVGVDIEKMLAKDNFPALINQIDSMDKAQELIAAGMSVQHTFYHLWCKREAVYKLKSQAQIALPYLYYNRIEDFMLCVATENQTNVEWILKQVKDYNV